MPLMDFYSFNNKNHDKLIREITNSTLKELFLVINEKKEGSLAQQQLASLISMGIQKKVEECVEMILKQKLQQKPQIKQTEKRRQKLD